jgi:hypothetical protein
VAQASDFVIDLGVDGMNAVMTHPIHQINCEILSALIAELHGARTYVEFDELQRRLFGCLSQLEAYHAEVRRNQSRMARRKLPLPTTVLQPNGDPSDPATWTLEDRVLDRAERQLRTVGDGLAWKASGFERRYIHALTNHPSAGPMHGKEGLDYEIGAAVEARERGGFALLHDLTNCLHIGDITEFRDDGTRIVDEVKRNPTKGGPQRRRIRSAIAAIMEGGEIPGSPGSAFVIPDRTCTTHVGTFRSLIREAQSSGSAARAMSGGRALLAISGVIESSTMTVESNAEARQQAMEVAGIADALHHVRYSSAHRNHSMWSTTVPFSLYPIDPHDAAFLICDYLVVVAWIDPDVLVKALRRRGLKAEVTLPLAHGELAGDSVVLRAANASRTVLISPAGLVELLFEFFDVASWAGVIAEVLEDERFPEHPIPAFATTRVWR